MERIRIFVLSMARCDDDDDDDGREEEYYPIDDTLSLLVFPFPPSLTIMLYGRLRVERGVRDEDADKVLDYYHSFYFIAVRVS